MNPEIDAKHQMAVNNLSNFKKHLLQKQKEKELKQAEIQQSGLKWQYLYPKSLNNNNEKEMNVDKISSKTNGDDLMRKKYTIQ